MSLECNHKRPYKREGEGDFTTEEKENGITKEGGMEGDLRGYPAYFEDG